MPIIKIDIASVTKKQKVRLIEKLTTVSAEITKTPKVPSRLLSMNWGDDNIGVGGKTLGEVKKVKNA
jgi:4-oxalocrotonate tautomerase